MAIGFMKMASKNGLEIPKDIAIAGFDDLPICTHVHPSLTSIRSDYQALGKKALKVLQEKTSSSDIHSGVQSIIPVTISIREST